MSQHGPLKSKSSSDGASTGESRSCYWNAGQKEVDLFLSAGGELWALEVTSGKAPGKWPGLDAFCKLRHQARPLIVGSGGMDLQGWMLHWAMRLCAKPRLLANMIDMTVRVRRVPP